VTHRQTFGLLALLLATLLGPVPSAAAEPKVLQVLIGSEPPQLNPMKATDQVSFMLLGHLMEGLTRTGKNSEIIPGVAMKWQIDDERATFELRRDARWADGKPVTAHDFVYAWRTVVDPKTASEYSFILYPIENAEAINAGKLPTSELGVSARDDWTLDVRFEKPCGYFLGLTSFATYLPAREDFHRPRAERYAADAEDLLANGPFVLTRWVHGSTLTLSKNPLYWDAERIHLDRIEIPYITSDPNTVYNLFIDGKVDTLTVFKDNLDRAQADRLKMKAFADGSVWYMEFNHRPERATRNLNLRKAIQLAFDPRELVSKVVGIPGTRPGVSFISSSMPGVNGRFRAEYPLTPVKPDLIKAKEHLELARNELGGTLPELSWLTDDSPAAARYAEYFQFLFKTRLGIDLKIDKQIFKQRLAKMTAGEFDIVSAGWGPDFADPMTFAELFTSWNDNNRGHYRNPKYDALIRRAQTTSDPKTRMDAMAEAEKLALDDLVVIPLYERVIIYAHNPRVTGIVRHAVGSDPDYTFVDIRQ
jgi:oligopeptide transport system substrate-binding protein